MQPAACPFEVVRNPEGAILFILPRQGGAERILYFQGSVWSTSSGEPVDSRKRLDLWSLGVGNEAYEIPDAVFFGG